VLNKGITLGRLNRPEEAITTYDEMIARFADATDPELREKVAKALLYKGITLGQLNRPEEAITTCEQMIARFADATEPELREQVADALLYRGILFEKLNKYPEAEHSLRKAIEFAPDSTEPDGKLIDLLLKMPERHDEALQTAEEIIGKKPDNPELLNSVAWTFYQHNKLFMLSQAERWATKAVSLMPNNVRAHHTLACILSALGKGTEALEPARRYIQDISVVEETIEDAIELFVELAASGYSKEALGILVNSEAEKHLEPLVVGLRLYVGEDVKTAPEIREVAKDVMNRIKERVKARKLINK
jgi:tetratricopeptide (TPR) repeat protein